MFTAMLVFFLYLMMMNSVYEQVQPERKLFTRISVHFALISAIILINNYFLQVSVIQPSLVNQEHDGISLLTQFNPHGIFITLEELGFTFMSLSFIMLVPALGKTRPEKVIRITAIAGFLMVIAAVPYTPLRAHETSLPLVCRLLLEKKYYITVYLHIKICILITPCTSTVLYNS